jgi:DNA-binding response OmpR family regulator
MSEQHIKLLLIEDNAGDADLISEMLHEFGGEGFLITHCLRLTQAFEALDREKADIVLSDLWLPDSHGIETFYRLRDKAGDTPIVVLTGNDDEKTAVQAVQQGAQDYLVKGFIDGYQLVRSLRYAVARASAVG